jgi:hypothetical protein
VARLVARLDGMPLAIELAAARVEALGVAQLLDRLDDRFALLTGGDRLAPGRQRSLAATVEWSYQLLDEQERRVFRAVSVFPGPFTLEAAEAVAGGSAGRRCCGWWTARCWSAAGRPGWPVPVRDAGDAARLRGRLLAEAGEQDRGRGRAGRVRAGVAEEAAAGCRPAPGRLAAARRLDAEDATDAPGAGLGHGARSGHRRCGWRPSRWRRGGSCAAGLSARERELVTLVAQGRTERPDRRAAVHQRPHRPLATWTGSGTRPAAGAAPT